MVPILMYHQIGIPPARGSYLRGATVHPRRFANQMILLSRLGYRGVSLREGIPYIRGEKQGKVVILTFDDGYENVFENARPILKTLGFSATNFIVTDRVGDVNRWMLPKSKLPAQLMTDAQIRQWHNEGFEIGSHTCNHIYLSQANVKEQQDELGRSKDYLEQLLGVPVDSFCYPYGDIDAQAIDSVKQAGYQWAVATHKGLARADDNILALPRVSIIRSNHLLRFYQKALTKLSDKARTVYW